MTVGDGKTIDYNVFNKPISITAGGVKSEFEYGADLARFKQVKGTETTLYIGKEVDITLKGNTVTTKTYIDDIAVVSKTETSGQVIPDHEIRFMHRDRLGSVVTLTDHNNNIMEQRSFDAFGKPRTGEMKDPLVPTLQGALSDTPYAMDVVTDIVRGFTDHEHLDDAELIHMNGRVYDYNLGRFLSVDPFVQSPGNSQSINPYSYIMNNPLAGTDPSGYKSICGVEGKRKCDAIIYPNGSPGFIAAIELKNGATVYVNTNTLNSDNAISEDIEKLDPKDIDKISIYDNEDVGWGGQVQISGGTNKRFADGVGSQPEYINLTEEEKKVIQNQLDSINASSNSDIGDTNLDVAKWLDKSTEELREKFKVEFGTEIIRIGNGFGFSAVKTDYSSNSVGLDTDPENDTISSYWHSHPDMRGPNSTISGDFQIMNNVQKDIFVSYAGKEMIHVHFQKFSDAFMKRYQYYKGKGLSDNDAIDSLGAWMKGEAEFEVTALKYSDLYKR